MPDICMCPGDGCEVNYKCYRFRAKPTEGRQSYFLKDPGKDELCLYYYPVDKDEFNKLMTIRNNKEE